MKILFLARRFYPDVGGVEKHVYEISKRFIEKGYEVTVITESLGKEDKLGEIKIVRIPKSPDTWFKKFHIWRWVIKNRSLFSDSDIIHAHDVFFWYFPLKLLFLSKKSFITFHGYESYPISKKAIVMRRLSEKLSNGNIIVGDFIKKWYGTKPTYVIYGGVDLPNKQTESKNINSAVFIGRLDYHTGIKDYAEAAKIIRRIIPGFKFTIVGGGEYKDKLKEFNLVGVKENTYDFLLENNFAFVSRYLSILEALASKRLIIAQYDNPIKEDYLKMAPFAKFIVIEENPEKLASKVLFYIKNPKEKEKMIKGGYEWVKKQSWENIINTYEKLWRN